MSIPIIDPIATGQNIKRLRDERKMTQQEVAKKIYVTNIAVCRWECGNRLPSASNLVALADLFGVKMEDVVAIQRRRR